MKRVLFLTVSSVLAVSGCVNLTGLDAESDFACAAPEGVACDSMGGVYANMGRQVGVASTSEKGKEYSYLGGVAYEERNKAGTDEYGRRPMSYGLNSGIPIRTQPKVMKIWVAPWQSEDRTLYDQSYAYIVLDYGDWVLAHNKNNIIDQYAPVSGGDGFVSSGLPSTDRVVEIPKNNNINTVGDVFEDESGGDVFEDESGGDVFNDSAEPSLTSGYSAAKNANDIAAAVLEDPTKFSKEVSGAVDENLIEQYSINANGQ